METTTTAAITSMAVNTLTGAPLTHTQLGLNNILKSKNENHVLHFNNLPKYMIQDILDLIKHCKIDDWTIYNKDKNTILSFRPEIKSKVDSFYENLTGYHINYKRMSL